MNTRVKPSLDALCDAIRRNDPSLWALTPKELCLRNAVRNVGLALTNDMGDPHTYNSTVSHMEINVSMLKRHSFVTLQPLILYLQHSRSLRCVYYWSYWSTYSYVNFSDPGLGSILQEMFMAIAQNPGITSFQFKVSSVDTPPCIRDLIQTTVSIRSLNITAPNSWFCDWEFKTALAQNANTLEDVTLMSYETIYPSWALEAKILQALSGTSRSGLKRVTLAFALSTHKEQKTVLERSSGLCALTMQEQDLTTDAMDLFVQALYQASVTTLTLKDCTADADAVAILNESVCNGKPNPLPLRTLYLECHSFRPKMFTSPELASLLIGSKLDSLVVDGTTMDCSAFFEQLTAHHGRVKLHHLTLDIVRMSQGDVTAMNAYLRVTTTLRKFTFPRLDTSINHDTILDALRANTSLIDASMPHLPFCWERLYGAEILRICKRNRQLYFGTCDKALVATDQVSDGQTQLDWLFQGMKSFSANSGMTETNL